MSVDDAMGLVASIDLAAVKRKVVEETGWSGKVADYAELRYRRFLCLHLLNPRLLLVPLQDIDAFWHQHILFTRAYVVDCDRLFGTYLHHDPGMGDAEEMEMTQQGVMETARLYADSFGEHYFASEPDGLSFDWIKLFD